MNNECANYVTNVMQVPLGILLKNETRGEDMVDIVAHHHHYVPGVEYTTEHLIEATGETVPVTNTVWR